MNSYPIRILRKNGKTIKETIKAKNFQSAYNRAGKSYKSWIDNGHDVQVFNPGENHTVPQQHFRGEH